jgi:hypothetical protein
MYCGIPFPSALRYPQPYRLLRPSPWHATFLTSSHLPPNFITLVIISERHRLRLSSFSFNIRLLSSKQKLLSQNINTLPPQYTRQHDYFLYIRFPSVLTLNVTVRITFQVCTVHIDIPVYLLCIRAESHWRNGRRQNELPICPIYYGFMHVFGIDETACSKI